MTFRSVRTVTLTLPDCHSKGFGKALAQSLQNGRTAAEEAVRSKNVQAFLEEAETLLGLGYGLPPSGDDYLSGLLLTLHIPGGPLENWVQPSAFYLRQAEIC